MKKAFITLFACIMAILTLTLTACDSNETYNDEDIEQAVSGAVDFLNTVKDGGNYSSVSEFSDGSVYKYYTEDGKIKVEYNQVFYGVKVGNYLYKISQADDMSWHMNTDNTDLSDPVNRTNNLINGINNISNRSLWSGYNSKTKTLTATFSDGKATYKLNAGEFNVTFITDSGTTKHIIKDVGDTTVTLPENIIDDTQITEDNTSNIDKETTEEIKAAFIAAHVNDEPPVTEDEISLRCYGVFDNVYVLFVDVESWGYTGAIETDIIADVQFIYSCSQKMTVYSDGTFYSLPDAYENGILSRDELLTLQENYIKDHEYLYKT